MTLKVGHSHIYDASVKKEPHTRPLSLRDIRPGLDGWIDVRRYLPNDFELVYMKIRGKPTIPGWIAGNTWEGIRLREGDEVIAWKKKKEDTNEK